MTVLSMNALPLGFRFRPTDEELVNHYLRLKINGRDSEVQAIPEVDVRRWEPWDLPGLSVIKTDDPEWFFFCPRHRKYPNGHRSSRATDAGYWKATGKDRTIKSKKSLIGMKRTLVFYSGRAPKGQRTNWIMHEYRATSEDLDGTAPGQGAFVICKLFNKEDERIDAIKYDEVDLICYSTTITKSSPDDASSDLVQEIGTPELKPQKQLEDMKRWLADKCDDVSQNGQVMLDSICNSHINSDVEDHAVEDNAIEGFPPFEENSIYYEPVLNQIDCKVFSPIQIHDDSAPYMDSLYASDFGNDHYGMCIQDGTGEQDVSLSELLLDQFFNGQEESCEEPASQKNSVAGSDMFMSGDTCMPRTLPPGNSYVKDSGTGSDTDTEVAQVQYHTEHGAPMWDKIESLQMPAFGSGSARATPYVQEVKNGYIGDLGNYSTGQFALPIESSTAFYGSIQNLEEPASSNNAVNNDDNPIGGTGIRIRSRQFHNRPNPANFSTQGIAPRRLRLQMELSSGSFEDKKEVNAGNGEEVQSTLTKTEGGENIPKTEKENCLPEFYKSKGTDKPSSVNLRRRVKNKNERNSSEVSQAALQPEAAPLHRGSSTSFSLVLGIFIIMILLVFSLGKWRLSY